MNKLFEKANDDGVVSDLKEFDTILRREYRGIVALQILSSRNPQHSISSYDVRRYHKPGWRN